ncbi:UNVERIFIED_CONTAM: hypothetical protein Slati_1753000 [Sesamum latifolium]|uniref:Uncharacterized protein n=1 Tax=Sesamum latifolium TaxID=2727402 RepID=A0AAW2WZL4_9LAMI
MRWATALLCSATGCLDAFDGTFIDVRVPEHEKGWYRTRKGEVAVSVLGVCNPNIQFIYFLSSWERSATDNRALRDVIQRPSGIHVSAELELPDARDSGVENNVDYVSAIESNSIWWA